jgi:multidrug efflux system membrane fusion protein
MARRRRFRWGFVGVGVVVCLLVAWAVVGRNKPAKAQKISIVAVAVAKAAVQDVPLSINALGSALPWEGVTVHTQVNGVLKRVAFSEGSNVTAGSLLAEIDDAPYLAALKQAQGALKRDKALLEEAALDLKRYQTLFKQDSIAQQQVDVQAALVKQYEGTVLLDQGAVDAAQVNVRYCRILSPVTGRVGVRLVDPGNIVSTTDATGIVIVNQIMPMAVVFTVPEQQFQELSSASEGFTKPLATEAFSQETGEALGRGDLRIADNHVDQATGTVEMKARFANPAARLWPSQFVNVKLTLKTLHDAITIPSAAVNHGPHGAFAYVVGPDDKVSVRPLKVLATQGDVAVIAEGLVPGATVVTDGQMLLKPGASVFVAKALPGKEPAA